MLLGRLAQNSPQRVQCPVTFSPVLNSDCHKEANIHACCPVRLCDPMDCNPPGSSVHGIVQARLLEWVAISFSRGSSQPRDQTCVSCVSCIGRWILY